MLFLWLLGCADIQPIEDGAVYGSVEVVKDWFTSTALVQSDETTLLVDAGCCRRFLFLSLSAQIEIWPLEGKKQIKK